MLQQVEGLSPEILRRHSNNINAANFI